jgi:hypothetical protein
VVEEEEEHLMEKLEKEVTEDTLIMEMAIMEHLVEVEVALILVVIMVMEQMEEVIAHSVEMEKIQMVQGLKEKQVQAVDLEVEVIVHLKIF